MMWIDAAFLRRSIRSALNTCPRRNEANYDYRFSFANE